MSLTITAILSSIAPQFDSNVNRDDHISLAELRTNETCYGNKYNYAVALRAAHTLTLSDIQNSSGSGSAGAITSKKEGDLSISFGSTGGSIDSYLGLTSYGKDLIDLREGSILPFQITGLTVDCAGNLTLEE